MTNSCAQAPNDKREYIATIGDILVKDYGKKKYYKPAEVKKAHKKSNYAESLDFSCWAMSVFSSHDDFEAYHQQTEDICDYTKMKTEMLVGLSDNNIQMESEIPVEMLDASWLDFGDLFEGIFEGIGSFIAAIFEGL